MKKLFISVPMRNRDWTEIEKSINYLASKAQEAFNEDFEIISSIKKEKPAINVKSNLTGLWYLGEALKLLSQADYFIGVKEEQCKELNFNGCVIESECAQYYHIEAIYLDLLQVCPDLK